MSEWCEVCEEPLDDHSDSFPCEAGRSGEGITPNEAKLAAVLLRMAADEFSNHGCNDFDLADYLPRESALVLQRRIRQADGWPEKDIEERTDVGDYAVMEYLANRLETFAPALECES